MFQAAEPTPPLPCTVHAEEQELCTRVQAEYREMPGLRLTVSQASRLFSIEPARCERVLVALVHVAVTSIEKLLEPRAVSVGDDSLLRARRCCRSAAARLDSVCRR